MTMWMKILAGVSGVVLVGVVTFLGVSYWEVRNGDDFSVDTSNNKYGVGGGTALGSTPSPSASPADKSPFIRGRKPATTNPPFSPTPKSIPDHVMYEVPFVSQAPSAQWDDDRFQNACEEASMTMAMAWVNDRNKISVAEAEAEILALVNYELEYYGQAVDHNAEDTAKIMRGYYNYEKVEMVDGITVEEIVAALAEGKIVIVPMNGQKLNNPNFTAPGPLQHMVVVIGYDTKTDELITNDPGTRNGRGYRYNFEVFEEAIRDYPTGEHLPITESPKRIVVVGK